jgi:hypothetical protein
MRTSLLITFQSRLAAFLMCLAAILELVALATVRLTEKSVEAAVIRGNPGVSPEHLDAIVRSHVAAVEIGAPIAAAIWLALACLEMGGYGWARYGAGAMALLTSISLLSSLSQGAAQYGVADAIAGGALWLVAVASALLAFDGHTRATRDDWERWLELA